MNKTLLESRADQSINDRAAVLAGASPTSPTETVDQRGQQRSTKSSPNSGPRVPVVLRLVVCLPQNSPPHCSLPLLNHNYVPDPQTLTIAPPDALSAGDRTPTAESPRRYQDDIDLRSPTTSEASEMSELNWSSGPC